VAILRPWLLAGVAHVVLLEVLLMQDNRQAMGVLRVQTHMWLAVMHGLYLW
jgi:hypothetical protein